VHILKALSILGLDRFPDERELKNAYREAAKFFHPDRNSGNSLSSQAFRETKEAYELLRSKKYSADVNVTPVNIDAKIFIDGKFVATYLDILPCGCRGGYTSPISVCGKCGGSGIRESKIEETVNIDECSFSQLNGSVVAEHDCNLYLLIPDEHSTLNVKAETLEMKTLASATQKDFLISESVIYKPLSIDLGTSYDSFETASLSLSSHRIFTILIRLAITI